MKIFAYNLRDFDEKPWFDKLCGELGLDYDGVGAAVDPTPETIRLAEGADYISIITTPIDAELMKTIHEMGIRMICTRSIGVDHIDMAAAAKYGVRVAHSLYAPQAVSDYTIMLMLMVNRHMKCILQRADIQDYTLRAIKGINMNTQTVGVIGTGKIGREVIRSLKGFGCRILAYDLFENDEVRQMADYVPLQTLLAESDIITLHMPLTDDNHHMIDAGAIAAMKDGVRIINTARGGLIDSRALIDGLESGKIGGAGLDCVENEFGLYYNDLRGRALDNEYLAILRSFPNVIVSPHMAFYTDTTVRDMVFSNVSACAAESRGEKSDYILL